MSIERFSTESWQIFTAEELKNLDHDLIVAMFEASVKDVEFWKEYGTWGDGKLESAKKHRNNLRRELLARLKAGDTRP